jgi:tetratricopeptide (TPR) repeat protein
MSKFLVYATAGIALLAGIVLLQITALARFGAASKVGAAEKLRAGARKDDPKIDILLAQARQLDPSYGRADWLVSREYLRKANAESEMIAKYKATEERARQKGATRYIQEFLQLQKQAEQQTAQLLQAAEREALQGERTFNSVDCIKHRAMIYLRQGRAKEAEQYLRRVLYFNPYEQECTELLGLLKLVSGQYEAAMDFIVRVDEHTQTTGTVQALRR